MRHLRFWLPVASCYSIILYFSVAHLPSIVAAPVAHFDKAVHFLEFLVLGVLLGSAVLREHHYQRIPYRVKTSVVLSVLVMAGAGESIQYLTKDRFPDWFDYLANVLGAGTGLASYFFEAGLILARRKVKSGYTRFASYHLMKRIYFWLPPFLIMGIITYFSHQTQAAILVEYRQTILDLRPSGTQSPFFLNLWYVHLIQFGPLGFFLARALAWEANWSKTGRRKVFGVIGIAVACAVSYLDEWHQGLMAGRVYEYWDVAFNFFGVMAGMLVYWNGYRYIRDKYFLR